MYPAGFPRVRSTAAPLPTSRRRRRKLLVPLIGAWVLLSVVSTASAVYIRHDRSAPFHNAIGSRPTFASSGFFGNSAEGFGWGSGTLIARNKVLTAAHIFDADANLRLDDTDAVRRMSFGTDRFIPNRLRANVKSVAINPAYKGGDAAHDVAVVTLKYAFHYLKPGRMSSQYAVGRRGAMVGYGFQGTGQGMSINGAEDKFGAFNEISVLRDGAYRTDFDNPGGSKSTFGSRTPLTYEGTTAPGDSGSALWADFGNNRWEVVGVLNGGFNKKGLDSQYGDISIYASLANPANVAFLRGQGLTIGDPSGWPKGAVAAGQRSMPEAATRAVPEPAGLAVVGLPLALGMLRRRARR